jgi:hypothetical protein
MKQLSYRIVQLGLGVIASVACAGTLSCSSSDAGEPAAAGTGGSTSGGGACTGQAIPLSFTPMYSAYDGGTHTFQVPAIANGVSGAAVVWSASDPTMVTFENDSATGGTIITTMKAGTVTIQAKAGDRCGTSLLTITQATPADWDVGNQRYNSGFPLPDIMAPGGGPPMLPADGSNPLEVAGKPPACTNCHGETATSSVFRTVSHTPQQTGGFSDDELIAVFMTGVIPPGGYYDSTILPQTIWQYFHKWTDITDAQKKGVLIYLRALTPKPQGGKIDFQQLMMATGGGAGGAPAGGSTGAGGTPSAGGATAAGGSTAAGGTTAGGGAGGSAGAGGTH